jgi:ATP/maltotriose-dependent transcriptional regulator MalT
MVAVVNGELAPIITGWVYCNALSTCHDLADLSRAVQWSEAATRWCDDLNHGQLYPGICRLHVVELACLRGTWETAAALAQQACNELTGHDPRYAGEAHYLIGELHRMTGDLDLAEEAFTRAHRVGRVPQPGLARVRMAQDRVDAAVNALRLALDAAPAAPLRRAELLVALAEAHIAGDDIDAAAAAAAELAALADAVASDYLEAVALSTEATVLLARGDGMGACRRAGEAAARFQSLRLPYNEASVRAVRGAAAQVIDERDTAQLELAAALDTFRRLGAEPDVRRVRALLGEAPPSPLSPRETEVIRLVARGATNKEIAAELFVSEHTVARHLSNIYTKLGVGSRSAATAFAYDHSLI